ncbi:type II toxin-antitoxin system VapC family toxin [Thiothrix nivea]|uniref:Ribonuclease VapC n=1 Tax=Thiothrix nivea (strain ATCC 35100 / DSM 5205 / JP2) TaxID=870187 RepID=A0A656HD09_THINJ|nr:type II toxin-antitoxin system VapC family toxin [Thiothrix nivea]EIJ35031.1 PilT protein domain protein [Thiothrix nivea DSM 5205]
MYLLDTNVISEIRKGERANPGVQAFFQQVIANRDKLFLSVVTLGELRRGLELIRHRNDREQADQLERWLETILTDYQDAIIGIDADIAQLWGRLRVPHYEHELDKLIAATALLYNLTVVTRNVDDFAGTGTQLLNPFT